MGFKRLDWFLSSHKNPMKPGNAPLQSIRRLDQVRERIRYMHYSVSTEKTTCAGRNFSLVDMGQDLLGRG
jgi:hypothetical protein